MDYTERTLQIKGYNIIDLQVLVVPEISVIIRRVYKSLDSSAGRSVDTRSLVKKKNRIILTPERFKLRFKSLQKKSNRHLNAEIIVNITYVLTFNCKPSVAFTIIILNCITDIKMSGCTNGRHYYLGYIKYIMLLWLNLWMKIFDCRTWRRLLDRTATLGMVKPVSNKRKEKVVHYFHLGSRK